MSDGPRADHAEPLRDKIFYARLSNSERQLTFTRHGSRLSIWTFHLTIALPRPTTTTDESCSRRIGWRSIARCIVDTSRKSRQPKWLIMTDKLALFLFLRQKKRFLFLPPTTNKSKAAKIRLWKCCWPMRRRRTSALWEMCLSVAFIETCCVFGRTNWKTIKRWI
jgi:hypothetical protein